MHLSENMGATAEKPLVSVVIPVYNVRDYLSKCLESVICQTYRNIEIIVIDDGSTDDSAQICDQFARQDSRIRVFHGENHGLSFARNRGITLSKGEYLLFSDSDDWMESNTVETLLDFMLQAHADIVTAGIIQEYIGQKQKGNTSDEKGQVTVLKGYDILSGFSDGVIRNVVWDKLYRIDCLKGISFPVGRNYEDIATTWKLMKNLSEHDGIVAVVSDNLFHYRVRKSSISHSRSVITVSDYWKAYFEQYNGLPGFREQIISSCMIAIGKMWSSYSGFSAEEKEKAGDLVQTMQRFSKAHFHRVMKGNYPLKVKLYCLLSQCNSPALKWICFYIRTVVLWVRYYRIKSYK